MYHINYRECFNGFLTSVKLTTNREGTAMNIAVTTDSSSGILAVEAEKMGGGFFTHTYNHRRRNVL